MKQQSPPADDIKRVHYSRHLPSFIPPDEQDKLIQQARLNSAHPASVPQAAGNRAPPPGFPSLNGTAGPSDARAGQVAPSPDRGRQTSGVYELLLSVLSLSTWLHVLGWQRRLCQAFAALTRHVKL